MSGTQTVEAKETIRIPHILAALEKYWMQNPDSTLGEILEQIAESRGVNTAEVEDQAVLDTLKATTPEWQSHN